MKDRSSAALPSRDLVLVGAGHTNLHVVRMWRMQPIPDVRLTLVSPFSRATYSGMLPGTLAGLYEPDDMEIDLWRLSESCGVRLIVDRAVGLEPGIHRVLLAERPPLRYDVASVGIGSVPGQPEIWSRHPRVLSIKPMATFLARFEKLLGRVLAGPLVEQHGGDLPGGASAARGSPPPVRIVVVGGGAGGTEVAFGLEARLQRRGVACRVCLVDAGPEILEGYSPGAVRRARRELARRGIDVHVGRRVEGLRNEDAAQAAVPGESASPRPRGTGPAGLDRPTLLTFARGEPIPADIVIWATAAAPPGVLEHFRLPKSDQGFLAVRPNLLTAADDRVFAVGDTASIEGHKLPKAGVYAVREGPVLWENLQRLFAGRELVPYEPQRGFLSLLSTGDGRAIAEYKGFSTHGRLAWKWKDVIDRRFMRMYQHYPAPGDMSPRSDRQAGGNGDVPVMRCAGCGSKVGSRVLAAALERLNLPADARAAIALDRPDDAAVLDRRAAPVDVLSVDFFPAFLDDPFLVGRVAALNALSDLWAMGSEPLGAMAIVTLPAGAPTQQTELLYQLLAGGLRELSAAGAALWGGHTTEGPELTIGYTVAGRLDGRRPMTKAGLKPGDGLILTKRIGTATLLAAHRECRCRAEWMDGLIASLVAGNAAAARVARDFDVEAATDVTGFALAGHLLEMLDAGGVSARLDLAKIPLLAGFAELSSAGVRSSLDPANRSAEARLHIANDALKLRPEYHALFDPQTSGGLLLGAPADRCDAILAALRAAGCTDAALIGEVVEADGGPPRLFIEQDIASASRELSIAAPLNKHDIAPPLSKGGQGG